MVRAEETYTLIGADGRPFPSKKKGTIGGHRGTKIFGRLDCPAALRAIARGGYVRHRVFFADTPTAQRAGYRPCAVCRPDAYRRWKASRKDMGPRRGSRAVGSPEPVAILGADLDPRATPGVTECGSRRHGSEKKWRRGNPLRPPIRSPEGEYVATTEFGQGG
jgi:hypothetical protein